jgi:hypothetical protein
MPVTALNNAVSTWRAAAATPRPPRHAQQVRHACPKGHAPERKLRLQWQRQRREAVDETADVVRASRRKLLHERRSADRRARAMRPS